ncbi:tRNA dihydrouridine synthase DusB [Acrocarpospora phusangensis]|nr:tRNA dihydrouridine synthase DusB [Acrocarpospora phusangensis]
MVKIGTLDVWPPVVLAPMAGITNIAFRTLCREQGGGIFVCEMITSRALVERNPLTFEMIKFGETERPRSLQLYGVDPVIIGRAAKMIAEEDLADHIDLNFGCPVPKVTRRGGGSALPYKRRLLREILRAAVANAGGLPVTMKMRKGIDDDHLTYLDAGRTAAEEGISAVALHARTARQHYGGNADWDAISRLKDAVQDIPVLGNGDIWTADDALRMVARTGCDGVVVGRGCLGRPWLFRDLENAFNGVPDRARPTLGEVTRTLLRHAELLCEVIGSERYGVADFRKHIGWYLKGFVVGAETRRLLALSSGLAELEDRLGELDHDQPWPGEAADGPRGKSGERQKVMLPHGWLDDPDELAVPSAEAEDSTSGG